MRLRVGGRGWVVLSAAWVALGALVTPFAAQAAEVVVVIGPNGLDPQVVEVDPGTTVTWVNQDGSRHRIRSTGGPVEFDSGNLDPGASFSATFDLAGSSTYRDERNPEAPAFQGTVTVSGDVAGSTSPGGTGPAPTVGRVGMVGSAFSPGTLTVSVGATVTWVNDDDRPHTVTAGDGSFDSGIVQPGATFARTFDRPGTYRYSCLLHSDMLGTVVVTDGSGDAPPPPAPPPDSTLPAPGTQPPPPSAQVTGAGSVRMEDNRFGPATLTVRAGTTVTWVNVGRVIHTATARDGSFDSGFVQPGGRFSRRFDTPGTYEYYCTVHPEMVGRIVVTDASGSAPSAAAGALAPTLPAATEGADHSSHGEGTMVEVVDQDYLPRAVTVEVGTRVTFHNTGAQPHSVTARDGSFDSSILATGDTWAFTFDTVGSFEYFCTLHPNMGGIVTVVESPTHEVAAQVAAPATTTTAPPVVRSAASAVNAETAWIGPLALGALLGGLAVGLVSLGRAMSLAGRRA